MTTFCGGDSICSQDLATWCPGDRLGISGAASGAILTWAQAYNFVAHAGDTFVLHAGANDHTALATKYLPDMNPPDPEIEYAAEIAYQNILAIIGEAEAGGCTVVVLKIWEQLSFQHANPASDEFLDDMQELRQDMIDRINRRLIRAADEGIITLVDTQEPHKRLHYSSPDHPNAAGQAAIGDALAAALST